jgi:hypothetical protein
LRPARIFPTQQKRGRAAKKEYLQAVSARYHPLRKIWNFKNTVASLSSLNPIVFICFVKALIAELSKTLNTLHLANVAKEDLQMRSNGYVPTPVDAAGLRKSCR